MDHYQSNPNPGGEFYEITIPLSEFNLLSLFEKMLSVKLNDPSFIKKAILSGTNNAFNLVQWTINFLDDIQAKANMTNRIKWVFNNIEMVSIDSNQLIIRGQASIALDNYVKK